MSNMIPAATVAAYRNFNDVSVDNFGIDCTLYVPTNLTTVDANDIYAKVSDITYTTYTDQKVFMLFSPNQKQLRLLGIFTEEDLPIIAFFKNTYKDNFDRDVNLDITISSYIAINPEFIPAGYSTEKFDVVDVITRHMHDATLLRAYKMAPRRVKVT